MFPGSLGLARCAIAVWLLSSAGSKSHGAEPKVDDLPAPDAAEGGRDALEPAVKGAAKGAAKGAEAKGRSPRAAFADVRWVTLSEGLAEVQKTRKPAVVLYDGTTRKRGPEDSSEPEVPPAPKPEGKKKSEGPTKEAAVTALEKEYLADSGLKSLLRKCVCVRLVAEDFDSPYPSRGDRVPAEGAGKGDGRAPEGGADPAGDTEKPADEGAGHATDASSARDLQAALGVREGEGSVVVLSFREEVVKRYPKSLPTKSRFLAELTQIWKVNEVYASEAKRVEKILDDSRYAHGVGKIRDAVLLVRSFEDPKSRTRMDPVLTKLVDEILEAYRVEARKAMTKGDALEAKRKYPEAIGVFDEVAKNYPLTEIRDTCTKRKGELLRKMTYGF